jgi:hypothetical protein
MEKIISVLFTLVVVLSATLVFSNGNNLITPSEPNFNVLIAQRGCCSHHGGVCGCGNNGHDQCCDGSTSPSCRC